MTRVPIWQCYRFKKTFLALFSRSCLRCDSWEKAGSLYVCDGGWGDHGLRSAFLWSPTDKGYPPPVIRILLSILTTFFAAGLPPRGNRPGRLGFSAFEFTLLPYFQWSLKTLLVDPLMLARVSVTYSHVATVYSWGWVWIF